VEIVEEEEEEQEEGEVVVVADFHTISLCNNRDHSCFCIVMVHSYKVGKN